MSWNRYLEYFVKEGSMNLEPRSLKLVFSTGVASHVVTGKNIGGEEYESIKVDLVESETNQLVVSGPEASVRARIVLLPEDFGGVWKSSEFKENVITNWKNKKNILRGDAFVDLKHGSGAVGNIWIKHDKKHLSKCKFRLGAMVVDSPYVIKEAVTNTFEVEDRRNELNRKSELVSLNDKVSRLKNIGKKIRTRLQNEKIMTVKDFLDNLSSNRLALQKIYGSNRKKWHETVRHAKTSIDKGCDVCGSVGSTSRRQDNPPFIDHGGFNELDVEPYEPSPSSDDTMPVYVTFPEIHEIEQCDEILSRYFEDYIFDRTI